MKVLSLFSGIGAFEKALTNMGVKYELVNYCEIDKYASKSYSAIHGVPESKNLGDITKVDTSKLPSDIDLITYGFPCQDISLAGHQRGFEHEGERTRSGLFFEALRLIEDLQPKFAICENVKNLTSKKFEKEFSIVLESLEEAGYKNYWKVLNAKDYGIPQNRERVFIISIREDIDKGYTFPEPYPLELRLKDMLDAEVDEKYYLSKEMFKYAFNIEKEAKGIGFSDSVDKSFINPDIANTIGCRSAYGQCSGTSNYVSDDREKLKVSDMKNPDCREAVNLNYYNYDEMNRFYDPEYLAPALRTMQGGNRQPKVTVREATKQGYAEAYEGDSINLEQPNSKTRRGRVGKGVAQTLTTSPQQAVVEPNNYQLSEKGVNYVISPKRGMATDINANVCQPLTAKGQTNWTGSFISPDIDRLEKSTTLGGQEPVKVHLKNGDTFEYDGKSYVETGLRIRKLTPKECFRLMGFDDEDYLAAEKVNSNTQLYKQAGNSIVVDVIEEIYEQLFSIYWSEIK